MLFLKFQIGAGEYLLDTARIVEVLQLVELQPLAHAPAGIAGLVNYRGTPVPAVDVSALVAGHRSEQRLSTRLVVAKSSGDAQDPHMLGLIVERASQTVRYSEEDFVPSGVRTGSAAYLGSVVRQGERLLHRIDLHKLLPDAVSRALFTQMREGA